MGTFFLNLYIQISLTKQYKLIFQLSTDEYIYIMIHWDL